MGARISPFGCEAQLQWNAFKSRVYCGVLWLVHISIYRIGVTPMLSYLYVGIYSNWAEDKIKLNKIIVNFSSNIK